jgi:gentisate 1,2-dioxygenase
MSVFPPQSYKKAHRHGPGAVIVIPAGEGYSIMWKDGEEKVVIPWHEGSLFVPPDRWFHQHFNAGATHARYLAMRTPQGLMGYSERVEDRKRDQIEYPDEEPWIREKFKNELAKIGLKSVMPEQAYQDHDFEWKYDRG